MTLSIFDGSGVQNGLQLHGVKLLLADAYIKLAQDSITSQILSGLSILSTAHDLIHEVVTYCDGDTRILANCYLLLAEIDLLNSHSSCALSLLRQSLVLQPDAVFHSQFALAMAIALLQSLENEQDSNSQNVILESCKSWLQLVVNSTITNNPLHTKASYFLKRISLNSKS